MATIGDRASLPILREKPQGLFLDAGDLGEVLLPRREMPARWEAGESIEVFLYRDSEDRPIATTRRPHVMPGRFGRLKCVEVTGIGAFLDWGLPKDLLVPFREQKARMSPGRHYVVHVHLDPESGRIVASTRLNRHLDQTPASFQDGQQVSLIAYAKTDLGYKMIVDGTHSGLLFASETHHPLQPGESLDGYIAAVREDGKIDLTLRPPGRSAITGLETRILAELDARGGFLPLGDHSSPEEIRDELDASKRSFKQALGALLKKGSIRLEPTGIRRIGNG